MLSSEHKIWIKTCRNLKDFGRRLIMEYPNKNWKQTNIERLFAKVAHSQFNQTHGRKSATISRKNQYTLLL